jgi:hypothetical protein
MKRPLIFTNHMAGAAEHHVVHFTPGIFQRLGGGVAQRSHAENLCGGFALRAAAGVFAVGKLMPDIGVGDEQLDRRIAHRHELGFPRAAIEQQEMVFAPHDGNELVHDAARNTGKFMLGLLTQQRLFNGIHFFAGDGFQQRRGADLERGTAGKSAAQRHGRMQQHVQPAGIDATREAAGNDAARIISPLRRTGFEGRGQINQHRLGTGDIADLDHVFTVIGLVGGHDGVAFDGHRQDKAIVVISVFADDVDAARRGDNPARVAPISLFKLLGNLNG